ncbi:kelch-like protein 36 [Branchiostoma floridae x Branchiostoma belcheri]
MMASPVPDAHMAPESPEWVVQPGHLTHLKQHLCQLQYLPAHLQHCLTYMQTVLAGLDALRREGLLCDVVLVAEGQEFPVHKNLLASSSDYFKAMFTGGLREAHQSHVELFGLSAVGLGMALDFMYSACIRVTMDNVENILQVASHLQLTSLLGLTCAFMEEHLSAQTWLLIYDLADTYALPSAKEAALRFAFKHFKVIAQSKEFLTLPVDKLQLLVASSRLMVEENVVLESVWRWLNHDPSRMEEYCNDIIRHVKFSLVPQEILEAWKEDNPEVRTNEKLFARLEESLSYHSKVYEQPLLQTEQTRVRADSESLMIIGGAKTTGQLSRLMCIGALQGDDKSLQFKPVVSRMRSVCYHSIVATGGFLYVAGGMDRPDPKCRSARKEVHRYDPRSQAWLQVGSMIDRRAYFYLAAVDGALYAVGGREARQAHKSVESYDFATNRWTYHSYLPAPLYGHTCTVHKGLLYISGGMKGKHTINEFLCMDPSAETAHWTLKPPMGSPRAYHAMASVGNKIYVFGGSQTMGNTIVIKQLIQYFEPEKDQWTSLDQLMPVPMYGFSAVSHGRFVYMVGGQSDAHLGMETRRPLVMYYDTETDSYTWEEVQVMPKGELIGSACCMLEVPNHVIQLYATGGGGQRSKSECSGSSVG